MFAPFCLWLLVAHTQLEWGRFIIRKKIVWFATAFGPCVPANGVWEKHSKQTTIELDVFFTENKRENERWRQRRKREREKKLVKSYYGRSLQEVEQKKQLSVLTETTANNPYTYGDEGSKKATSAGNFLTLLILFGVVLTFVGSEIDLHGVVCSLFFRVSFRCYVDEVLLVRTTFLETWNSIDYNKRRNETRKKSQLYKRDKCFVVVAAARHTPDKLAEWKKTHTNFKVKSQLCE